MRTIWKIELSEVTTEVQLPIGAKFLHVGNQREKICLWFEVESTSDKETRRFEIAGTGKAQAVCDKRYLGSAIFADGAFVWHVYELLG